VNAHAPDDGSIKPDLRDPGAMIVETGLEPVLNKRECEAEHQPPEDLRQSQPCRRISLQERLKRAPIAAGG
jgi:hypothetical protein